MLCHHTQYVFLREIMNNMIVNDGDEQAKKIITTMSESLLTLQRRVGCIKNLGMHRKIRQLLDDLVEYV